MYTDGFPLACCSIFTLWIIVKQYHHKKLTAELDVPNCVFIYVLFSDAVNIAT
jgi:hypothetical protein